jgi:hypothetical protein
VILLVDQATGGYSTVSNEQRIGYLTIDGANLPGAVDGIQAQGYVHGVYLEDVAIRSATSHGIAVASNGSGSAYSWRGTRVRVYNSTGIGFSVAMTDCTWIDCEALNAGSHGWFLGAAANTHLIGCRAEWSAFDGFNVSGNLGTGTGSGGFTMTDCSTDRNGHNGVFFSAATGNAPVQVTGAMLRRDGRNGGSGGGGYAGLQITGCTAPINVNGATCYPGVDDNGSGANSPQYGVSVTATSTKVSIDAITVHAAATAWNDDGTNTITLGSNIQMYTGATSAPVAVALPAVNIRTSTNISRNVVVGSASAIGDNGVGELQLADATTVPSTNPTAGSTVYSESATPHPLKLRDAGGNVRSLVDGFAQLATNPTFTAAGQAATPVTLAVQASATYLVEAGMIFTNTTGSTTFSWTGPAGATMQWADTTGSGTYVSTIGGTDSFPTFGTARMTFLKGLLIVSGTPGSLTATIGVSTGTTTLNAGSWLRLTRVK